MSSVLLKERPRIGRQKAAILFHELLAEHPGLLTPEQRYAHELRAALEAVRSSGIVAPNGIGRVVLRALMLVEGRRHESR